jgi:F-type H+-transporting ATPase subunit alpha
MGTGRQILEVVQLKQLVESLKVPVGDAFLGRVVNPLAAPIDGKVKLESDTRLVVNGKLSIIVVNQFVSHYKQVLHLLML